MKLTYADAKTAIARVLNLNSSDARVLAYLNEAQERLLYKGDWKDTNATYVICTANACLTWPREIETIEAAAMCRTPITIRNGWYEYLEGGWGLLDETSGPWLTLADRIGSAVAFDDVIGSGKKIAVYADGSEEAGSTILLRYYNSSAQKVRTTFNGETIEGERVVIPTAGNYSYTDQEVMPFGLYEVVKPVTNNVIRLFEYTVADGTLKPLAYYEPDETNPEYRRSLIPCLQQSATSGGTCDTTKLTVSAKRRFIPATNDDSVLMIPHLGALKLACKAVFKEEANLFAESAAYWAQAKNALDEQLMHHQGKGQVTPMRVTFADGTGIGVLNMI